MKLVKCIVRPHKVDEITDALKHLDVSGITLTEVSGRGRRINPTAVYRGTHYELRFLPEMMLDVVVDDSIVDDVVRIVIETAHTGRQGDGQIFVIPVEQAYTVRTRVGGLD